MDVSGPSHLQITFKDTAEPASKQIYYQVGLLRRLHGGESQTLIFDVLDKKIVFGRPLVAEVDTYKKVDEVNEENNWRTMFPETVGSGRGPNQCHK